MLFRFDDTSACLPRALLENLLGERIYSETAGGVEEWKVALMVYRYLDAHEVLIEVIGDIEDAKIKLSLAVAKMDRSGLAQRPEHEEIVRFIGVAQRYAGVATKAALRSRGVE